VLVLEVLELSLLDVDEEELSEVVEVDLVESDVELDESEESDDELDDEPEPVELLAPPLDAPLRA
jgi:hypothetical protein